MSTVGFEVRDEQPADHGLVHALNQGAFARAAEAELVDVLRVQAQPLVSLVAESAGTIIGHILFSPVTSDADAGARLMGLAPMAVVQARRRQGVGSALVRAGLARCHGIGAGAVVVLGHPLYYPRFGFVPATHFRLSSEYAAPADAFMALELEPGYLQGRAALVRFHAAFAGV